MRVPPSARAGITGIRPHVIGLDPRELLRSYRPEGLYVRSVVGKGGAKGGSRTLARVADRSIAEAV